MVVVAEPDGSAGVRASSGGDHSLSTRKPISEDQFTCPCCFQLMMEPTTLNCGHSFCRYCLAKWTETSKKQTCPECRQDWVGQPSVNITLRETICALFPQSYGDRLSELPPDYEEKLSEFGSRPTSSMENLIPGYAFICGILCALVLVLVPWLYTWLGATDYSLLVHKPALQWSPKDVHDWMMDLGSWAEGYAERFLEKEISGHLLLAISDEYLTEKFNMSDLHKKALLISIENVRELGVKPPTNLWEYKELYPRNFIFFMSTVQVLPRSLLLYTFIYNYDDTFLPFFYAVCPIQTTELSQPYYLPPPTTKQWIHFLPPTFYLPYLVIAKFAWLWFSIHSISVTMVTVICLSETFQEANSVVLFYRSFTRGRASAALGDAMKTYARSVIGQSVLYFVWPVTPWVLCEVYFYFCVYILPLQTACGWLQKLYSNLQQQHRQQQQQQQLQQ